MIELNYPDKTKFWQKILITLAVLSLLGIAAKWVFLEEFSDILTINFGIISFSYFLSAKRWPQFDEIMVQVIPISEKNKV